MYNISEEKSQRIKDLLNQGEDTIQRVSRLTEKNREKMNIDLQISKLYETPINHVGLTREQYMAHPLRMMEIILKVEKNATLELLQLALLHNIKEISNVPVSRVAIKGTNLIRLNKDIDILTINRRKQYEQLYLQEYYRHIKNDERLSKIKCIDKLDNLYMIGLNPNPLIRRVYLAQIEEFVMPILEEIYPQLVRHVHDIIIEAKKVGFMRAEFLQIKHAKNKRNGN